MITKHKTVEQAIEKYTLAREPYYLAVADEVELFEAAYKAKLPVMLKDLKQSTRQRFVSLEFDYPPPQLEAAILMHEGGVDEETARDLVLIGEKVRNLKGHGLEEGVSTRLLVYAAQLVSSGIAPHIACEVAISSPITDGLELQRSIREIVTTVI